jgi:hypothetical protein
MLPSCAEIPFQIVNEGMFFVAKIRARPAVY